MTYLNRRRFFEESMIATAIAAATPQLFAADDTASTASNETIRHAVIGCRIRGRVHAREFAKQDGVEVAYVCDPDISLANELAAAVEEQQGKRPQILQDLRKIFDDKTIDTVSIAAPNHWHALAAIWAMQSEKDVYVEKPVSHNVVEGRRIVEFAEKTGRICQAGTQRRSIGALKATAAFIQQGGIGDVTFARSIIYGRRGSIGARGVYDLPKNVDYNLWLGPAPMTKLTRPKLHYDWHWDWNTGGGELANNNIHIIDACRMLMGLEGLGQSVLSLGGRMSYEDAGDTPNTQIVMHDFGKTTIVQEVRGLKSDPFSSKFKAGWVIRGSEGFIAEQSLFDLDGKLVKTFNGPSENHFANFIKAVRSRKRSDLNADITEGHPSSALCHVGNISYRVGQALPIAEIKSKLEQMEVHEDVARTLAHMVEHLKGHGVDVAKTPLTLGQHLKIDHESFIDNKEASRLLGRTYRKPFTLPTV